MGTENFSLADTAKKNHRETQKNYQQLSNQLKVLIFKNYCHE